MAVIEQECTPRFQVGDLVAIGPLVHGANLYRTPDWPGDLVVNAAVVNESLELHWHPALPAVAALLSQPGFVASISDLLENIDWHYETTEIERAGRALIAALTEEDGHAEHS